MNIKQIDLKELYDSIISNINEDSVIAGDAGSSSSSNDGIISDVSGNTATDILGKCDHKNDGYFSSGCFHVPSNILKPKKPKKSSKNPYLSRIIINETELTAEALTIIGNIKESELVSFINSSFTYAYDTNHMRIINVDQIAYDIVHKIFWIKCISNTHESYFAQVSFNIKTKKFIPVSTMLFSISDIHDKYSKNFSSMNMFIVWKENVKW